MIVRAETPADHAAVREVTARAFAHHPGVDDLVNALRNGPGRISLVAEEDGAVVGHTMLSRGWVDAAPRLVDVLVLSPLSVDPPAQRRGIGGALVRAAIDAADAAGTPAVFLEGSPRYYPRFGFVPGGRHGFTRPSVRIPEPAFQVVLLSKHEPWMTGALVYPDVFWALDFAGLR